MITTKMPIGWEDYELIDCGDFEKLERFGEYILIRPEPQAVWDKSMSENEWQKTAHVKFIGQSPNSGTWQHIKKMPDRWNILYELNNKSNLVFRLALTNFKHVGIFPEQANNWQFIYNAIKNQSIDNPNVLNLFAYTGGASLAAKAAGANVTHIDSVKQIVNWASENMRLSSLDNIRWVIDDAVKYVNRDIRRERIYQGIILDPPAYGHGPSGESWKLERDINPLLKSITNIIDKKSCFIVINTYSLGFSSYILQNLFDSVFGNDFNYDFGELVIIDSFNKKLPLGVFIQANTK